MSLRPGGQVILHGLSARADLNGASGVLKKYDEEKGRWNVAVDGQAKKLALKAENLRAVSHPAEALPAAPEEVVPTEFLYCRVQARVDGAKKHAEADVVDIRVDPEGRLWFQVQPEAGGEPRWCDAGSLKAHSADPVTSRKRPKPADFGDFEGESEKAKKPAARKSKKPAAAAASSSAAAADDAPPPPPKGKGKAKAAAPMSKAEGKKPAAPKRAPRGGGGGSASSSSTSAASSSSAALKPSARDAWEAALDAMQPNEDDDSDGAPPPAAAPAPPARDPRMQGFRIGGQAETAEERGEGWCGPWSTAVRLINEREAAKARREEEAEESGEAAPPLVAWAPTRDPGRARPPRGAAVPSLQSLVVSLLSEHIDSVEGFGVLAPHNAHELAASLCRRRRLGPRELELLTPADGCITELIVPDCHLIPEEDLAAAVERLTANQIQLSLLHLGYCGRCLSASVAAQLHTATALESLRLGGCFRLTDAALVDLLAARGGGLRHLHLSGNSQLSARGVAAIGAHCASLEELELEGLDQLPPDALLPLGARDGAPLSALRRLSLGGVCQLTDAPLVELLAASAATLRELKLSGCVLLTDAALASAARLCPYLEAVQLDGLELLTDAAVAELAAACPNLATVALGKCVQLSDASVAALAAGCGGVLRSLAVNNCPAMGDGAIKALVDRRCDALEALDVSWCRGVSDQPLGALVDRCAALRKLTIWGCSQLTPLFFNGHKNDALEVVGRGPGQ